MARLNPMMYQAQLEEVLNAGRGVLVIEGELNKHKYITKAKDEETAKKEQEEGNLSMTPAVGYVFSVKDAKVVSGAGVGTIMEQIIASGFKPSKKGDGSTFVECRCGRRAPKLYVNENGNFIDITKEFENKPLSYQGPVQVCYSLSKGTKDGRIYINTDGVLFATKPDVFVPEESNGANRDIPAAFAATAFYGQTAAPAQPAGFAQAVAPAQAAPVQQAPVQQAAPIQKPQTVPVQQAPVQQGPVQQVPVQQAPVQQPQAAPQQAAPAFQWPC